MTAAQLFGPEISNQTLLSSSAGRAREAERTSASKGWELGMKTAFGSCNNKLHPSFLSTGKAPGT
jgi:hypothetical protein